MVGHSRSSGSLPAQLQLQPQLQPDEDCADLVLAAICSHKILSHIFIPSLLFPLPPLARSDRKPSPALCETYIVATDTQGS